MSLIVLLVITESYANLLIAIASFDLGHVGKDTVKPSMALRHIFLKE
jgi:hypothetical protein